MLSDNTPQLNGIFPTRITNRKFKVPDEIVNAGNSTNIPHADSPDYFDEAKGKDYDHEANGSDSSL